MRRGALALVLLAACSGELTIAVPNAPGTKSVILAIEQSSQLEVHAFEFPAAGTASKPLHLTLTDDSDVELTALLYPETLEEKRLRPGKLARAATGETSELLPMSANKFSAVLAGDDLSKWTAIDRLEGDLAAYAIHIPPPPTVCEDVHSISLEFVNSGRGFWNIAILDRDHALAAKSNNSEPLYQFERAGGLTRLEIPGLDYAVELVSDHRGTGYVSALGTEVFQVKADGEVIARTPLQMYAPRLAATEDGTVFAGLPGQLVELVHGSTVTIPHAGLPLEPMYQFIAPSRDRMAIRTQTQIHVYENGQWTVELEEDLDDGELFGDNNLLGYVHPGFGVLIRDEQTHRWRNVLEPKPGDKFYTARALGGGRYLIAGDAGLVRVFADGVFCPVSSGTLRSFDAADWHPSLRTAILATEDLNTNEIGMWLDFPDSF